MSMKLRQVVSLGGASSTNDSGAARAPILQPEIADHPGQALAVLPSRSAASRWSRPSRPVLENAGGQDQGIAIANHGADGATCLGDPSQRIHGARVSGLT